MKFWFLKDFDLLENLDKPSLKKLSDSLDMKHYKKGRVINFDGKDNNYVFFLKQGSILIQDCYTKRAKDIVKRGNIFGKLMVKNSAETTGFRESAKVLEDSIVCFFSSDQMNTFIEEHRDLKNSIIKFQNFKIKRLEIKLSDLIHKDSETRIKDFITSFVTEYGKRKENYIEVSNFLSHKNIGDLTNTSRQTVNNVLTRLRKNGRIDYSRKSILLYD